MERTACQFMRNKKIDSYPKLFLLIYFCDHPYFYGTDRTLAEETYLGDTAEVASLTEQLRQAGLITRTEQGYRLNETPELKFCLTCLLGAFEDPMMRQKLLKLTASQRIRADWESVV